MLSQFGPFLAILDHLKPQPAKDSRPKSRKQPKIGWSKIRIGLLLFIKDTELAAPNKEASFWKRLRRFNFQPSITLLSLNLQTIQTQNKRNKKQFRTQLPHLCLRQET